MPAEVHSNPTTVPDTFGFIIHPIHPKRDVSRKWPWLGRMLTEGQVDFLSAYFPPVYISQIDGARSISTGRHVRGWFIACPFTPRRMLQLPVEHVYNKIVACGKKAAKLGARILGLGAFTSVVGDAGVTIAERLEMPVTTGDSYTIYIAVESIRRAADVMGVRLAGATAAIVGATGAIGSVCAQMLAGDAGQLTLIGRRPDALEQVREKCEGKRARISTSTDIALIYNADVILTVSSAVDTLIQAQHLKPGAVILDVARPRDVSIEVVKARDDVLVIEGGMVEVPGPVDFHFDFGFPPKMAYACMAETMALAMEGRYEDYTVGRELTVEQALEIGDICTRHGFRVGGFRCFERAVDEAHVAGIRERAQARMKTWAPARA